MVYVPREEFPYKEMSVLLVAALSSSLVSQLMHLCIPVVQYTLF
jgi:hypothetical protein